MRPAQVLPLTGDRQPRLRLVLPFAATELGAPLTALGRGGDEEPVLDERISWEAGVRRLPTAADLLLTSADPAAMDGLSQSGAGIVNGSFSVSDTGASNYGWISHGDATIVSGDEPDVPTHASQTGERDFG